MLLLVGWVIWNNKPLPLPHTLVVSIATVFFFHSPWTNQSAGNGICDVAQLSICVRGIDDNFDIVEELVFEAVHGKTRRGSDIFEKAKSCRENQQLDLSKLLSVCIDGALSMIGKAAGAVTLLERFLGRPLLKYNCVIHQEFMCGKVLNLQHVMVPIVKCVKRISARRLNRRQFREDCELLDEEYGDLILHY